MHVYKKLNSSRQDHLHSPGTIFIFTCRTVTECSKLCHDFCSGVTEKNCWPSMYTFALPEVSNVPAVKACEAIKVHSCNKAGLIQ